MSLLAGRMNRRTFFVCYLCLVAAEATILIATGNDLLVDILGLMPWLWMASKRLHDFNVRWWWSLVPFAVGFLWGFVDGFMSAAHASELLAASPTADPPSVDWRAIAQHPWDAARGFMRGFWGALHARAVAHPVEFSLDAALLLVLIVWPGTRGPNRFGDPPGSKVS